MPLLVVELSHLPHDALVEVELQALTHAALVHLQPTSSASDRVVLAGGWTSADEEVHNHGCLLYIIIH